MRDREVVKAKDVGTLKVSEGRIVEAVGTATASLGDKKLGKLMEEAESKAVMDCYAQAAKKPEALGADFIREAKRKAREETKAKYYSDLEEDRAKEQAAIEERDRKAREGKLKMEAEAEQEMKNDEDRK